MKRLKGTLKFFEDTQRRPLMSKCVGLTLAPGTLSLAPPPIREYLRVPPSPVSSHPVLGNCQQPACL